MSVTMTKASMLSSVQPGIVDRCHRCGGLMVAERVFEIGLTDWHCLSCGERIDPVILEHRRKDLARAKAEKLVVGHAKSRLS